MTLDATAKAANVAKSIYGRIGPLLVAQSLTVDYEGTKQNLSDEWVQMALLDSGGGVYAGLASTTKRGMWKSVLLSFNIFIKEESVAANTYRARIIRDIILGQAELGSEFNLVDYETAGTPAVGVVRINEIFTDRRIPNTEGYYQYNLTLRLDWLEKF